MIEEKKIIIAIDGPSASGKGTLVKSIAKKLNYDFMDTGALYRLVAKTALEMNIDESNQNKIIEITKNIKDNFNIDQLKDENLKTDKIGILTSKISAIPEVRNILTDIQRNFPNKTLKNGVILDGRDIGTIICPNADVKLYITATIETRALRRAKELRAKNIKVEYETVLDEMEKRDHRDKTRKTAPTKPADDAYIINTSTLTPEEVLKISISIIGKKI